MKALNKNLIIVPDKTTNTTDSGIEYVEAHTTPIVTGVIQYVADGITDVAPGDHVVYPAHAYDEYDGTHIVDVRDLYGILCK